MTGPTGAIALRTARPEAGSDTRRLVLTVAVLALAHFVMEFTCGTWLAERPADTPAELVLIYNACAFLAPLAIGVFADRLTRAGAMAAAGCAAVAIGALGSPGLLPAAIVLGLGNAVFHVAGGMTALRMPRPATAVGVFVATGAIGLAGGLLVGASRHLPAAVLTVGCLATAAAAAWALRHPMPPPAATDAPTGSTRAAAVAIALAALVCLGLIRTLVMTTTPATWKAGAPLVLAAASAAALGKAAGGILGDRFGLRRVAVIATITATLLVAVAGVGSAALGLAGIVAINLTIPLVLAMIASLFPGREGTVFGLGQAIQFTSICAMGVSVPVWLLTAAAASCVLLALVGFTVSTTKGRP